MGTPVIMGRYIGSLDYWLNTEKYLVLINEEIISSQKCVGNIALVSVVSPIEETFSIDYIPLPTLYHCVGMKDTWEMPNAYNLVKKIRKNDPSII